MAKRGLNRLKHLPKGQFDQAMNLANLIRSMLNEIEVFIRQIVEDNFDEETVLNLSSRITLSCNGTMVNVEIYYSVTNTTVIYDMTLADLLKYITSSTLEYLMNDKVPKMVEKCISSKYSKYTNQVYLESNLK